MEEYKKIYPELAQEPPKDGNAFRLQQSCRVLENLEKEAKHYASVRKKYKRLLQRLVENLRINRNSFVLSQRFWELEQLFWGWTASRRITWWPWSYLWSFECYHWRSWKKCFTESDETRKNCFLFASQKLIALKTESQKLWRMTGFLAKSSKTFSPRCQNIMR